MYNEGYQQWLEELRDIEERGLTGYDAELKPASTEISRRPQNEASSVNEGYQRTYTCWNNGPSRHRRIQRNGFREPSMASSVEL